MIQRLIFFLLLIPIVVFHEFSHLFVAKSLGIDALTFSIGFGPKLLSFDWNQTEYRLSLLPLGGYVEFHPSLFSPTNIDDKIKLVIIMASGGLINILMGTLAFYFLMGKWFLPFTPIIEVKPLSSIKKNAVIASAMSVHLGLLNLLPIPPLDGGKIAMLVYESYFDKTLAYQSAVVIVSLLMIGYCLFSFVMFLFGGRK